MKKRAVCTVCVLTLRAITRFVCIGLAAIAPCGAQAPSDHLLPIAYYAAGAASVKLSQASRAQLALALAMGDDTVSVLIAARRGCDADVVRRIAGIHGSIRFRDDSVDYIRARIPIAELDGLAQVPNVEALELDHNVYRHDRKYFSSVPLPSFLRSRGTLGDAPLHEPYWPGLALRADRFLKRSRTFDGRGVTIGFIDSDVPDLLLPEFQVALSLNGKAVHKIVGVYRTTDPEEEPIDGGWVRMRPVATDPNRLIRVDGGKYLAPRAGLYQFGVYEGPLPRNSEGIFNASQHREESGHHGEGYFALLWDQRTGEVWVDADHSHDFSNRNPVLDGKPVFEFGILGTDDPKTPVRETIGYTLQPDKYRDAIAVTFFAGWHATEVAGQAAANGGDLGRYRGIAPGARYAFAADGSGTTHSEIEALLLLAANPQVDVIAYEWNSYTDYGANSSGLGSIVPLIADRAAVRYDKPIVVPVSNSYGTGLVSPEVRGSHLLGIGGYSSRDAFTRNTGIMPARDEIINPLASSSGPEIDGRLSPDVLSPTGDLGSSPGYAFPEQDSDRPMFSFPPGYRIGGGTSEATPNAAGAIALLISAARQRHVPYDLERLNYAIRNSARQIPGYPSHQQGNGLIDIDRAWQMLCSIARRVPPVILARAPVLTVVSPTLAIPNQGSGLYEREGWSVGDNGDRYVVLQRVTGTRAQQTFEVRWLNNDGTFSGPTQLALPLNSPVTMRIHIHPDNEGVHSAILALRTAGTPGFPLRMLATIVVAPSFDSESELTRALAVERPGSGSIFVRIPPHLRSVKLSIQTSGIKPADLYPVSPSGFEEHGNATIADNGGTLRLDDPQPGVWEFVSSNFLDMRSNKPSLNVPLPSTRTIFHISSQEMPVSESFTHRDIGGPIGSMNLFPVTVPRDVSSFRFWLQGSGSPDEVDLYAIQCTIPSACRIALWLAWPGTEKAGEIKDPTPGLWYLATDIYSGPKAKVDPLAVAYSISTDAQ